jgi:nitroreductase
MSIGELIRSRRTIHEFQPGRLPPESVIIDAIDHAVWAPNHHLTQPWRFRLLGRETSERICRLNAELARERKGDRAAEIKLRRWREIPGWVLLTCVQDGDEVRRREDFAACCCAAQLFMLRLWEQGVGVKWTTGDVTRHPEFFRTVELDPRAESVVGLFWYGYPAEVPAGTRRPSDTFISRLP